MDLLQVIIPQPSEFCILLDNNEEIRIIKYNKIDIDFGDRVEFLNGERKNVKSPLITYRVILDDKSKIQLGKLFSNSFSNSSTLQSRRARIRVGRYKYVFNVEITARPDMRDCLYLSKSCQSIKICLRLENTNISLFNKADEAYEIYNRFDILDL